MAAKKAPTTLVSPKGHEHTTTDRSEVTNLVGRGYKVKPKTKASAPTQSGSGK